DTQQGQSPGRADQAAYPRDSWRQWRGLVGAHAAPDPALPPQRPRGAVGSSAHVIARLAAFAKAPASRVGKPRRSLGGDGTGRPSIPETFVREPIGPGVPDVPHARGMTTRLNADAAGVVSTGRAPSSRCRSASVPPLPRTAR